MKYETPDDIPDRVVERTKKLKTYIAMAKRRARDKGVALESLTDDEWRQIYWDKSKARHKYYQKKEVPERVEVQMEELKPVAGTVQTELEKYLEYYEDPAPNDLLTIQQLISMQGQLETLDSQIEECITQEQIPVARWRDLARIQKELSAETRQLQEMLGISRRAREARKHDEELADQLRANINQARNLIDDYGIKLECPHCLATENKRINQGFIIHHFPEAGLEVKTRCPACQKGYEIVREPKKWERRIG
jgi:rubrerythrin